MYYFSVTNLNVMMLSAGFNYKLLGKAMKVVRQLKGYKQEYVSAKTGIPQSMYSKAERGESHLYVDKLIAVCEVLEVSPLLLFYCAGYKKAYVVTEVQTLPVSDKAIIDAVMEGIE